MSTLEDQAAWYRDVADTYDRIANDNPTPGAREANQAEAAKYRAIAERLDPAT